MNHVRFIGLLGVLVCLCFVNKMCIGAENAKSDGQEDMGERLRSTTKKPTTGNMETLGRLAAHGSLTAIDELEKTVNAIYSNIDYAKDQERVLSNLSLMSAAFAPIAEKAGNGSLPAMEALKYANGKKRLRSFTPYAFGIAAGMGNTEALGILLNYKEHGLLLSSTVFALQSAAEKNIPEAVDFLVQVINNPADKPLWFGASQGLVGAATRGNEKAKVALKKYGETND